MSYCLNPDCQQPQNPGDAKFCQTCGSELVLNDRYRAVKLIGQGGFGRTFLAIDEWMQPTEDASPSQRSPSYCVIKQSFPRYPAAFNAQQSAALFQQEARRLADLGHHPQIPDLLDYFEIDDRQYLVQEFVTGQNLDAVLAAEGVFSEDRIRTVLNDLLPVLCFIHDHQVIHRDIKPENIICPGMGNAAWSMDGRPLVLVDFGSSKYAPRSTLAHTGTVIGSAAYAAPEQAMGRAEFASDLYSLGVTCVHLLIGLHPFDLYSVSDDAWVWRQYLVNPISPQLTRILNKLLQKATSQRYRTAIAVLEDLNRGARVRSAAQTLPPAEEAGMGDRRLKRRRARVKSPWQEIRTLEGHMGAVTAIAIHPDGQTLASGSRDKTIKLWNLSTGDLLHTIAARSLWFNAGHNGQVSTLMFTLDGKTLISGSEDGTIKLWDLLAQKLVITLPGHEWDVSSLAVSADGHILFSGGSDGMINRWDLDTHTLSRSLVKHRDRVSALLLRPDDRMLISGSYDKTIRIWDVQNDCLLNTLRGEGDKISAIAVTPDWQTVISGGWDRTIRLWNLRQGTLLRTLIAHKDRITALAISPDGRTLASASEDSTVKVWDVVQGSRLYTLGHAWSITALSFSPDGRRLVGGSADETVKIWQHC